MKFVWISTTLFINDNIISISGGSSKTPGKCTQSQLAWCWRSRLGEFQSCYRMFIEFYQFYCHLRHCVKLLRDHLDKHFQFNCFSYCIWISSTSLTNETNALCTDCLFSFAQSNFMAELIHIAGTNNPDLHWLHYIINAGNCILIDVKYTLFSG